MEFLNEIELDADVKTQLEKQFRQEAQKLIEKEVQGLKSKNDEILHERTLLQEKIAETEAKAKRQQEEKLREDNDYKQLFEAQKQESDTLRKTIEQMNKAAVDQKVQGEAAKIAGTLTKDLDKAKLLQKEISGRLTLVDNEVRVTDETGQLTVSSLDELTTTIRDNYPFLVDGSQAQGGGAVRAIGGADSRSKQMSRAEWEDLGHAQRAAFFREGGKIVNE